MNIYTLQMSNHRKVKKRYEEEGKPFSLIDITVKNSPMHFLSPIWKIVWDHKSKLISDEEYKKKYYSLVEGRLKLNESEFIEFFNKQESDMFLMCFCASGKFCHRHLAIDLLKDIHKRLLEQGKLAVKENVQFLGEWAEK